MTVLFFLSLFITPWDNGTEANKRAIMIFGLCIDAWGFGPQYALHTRLFHYSTITPSFPHTYIQSCLVRKVPQK